MNTHIYFVRHAHSTFDLENEELRGLSAKGWEDAEKVTDILQSENIDYVISSPYQRAIQTVEGLSRMINKEVKSDIRFREGCLADKDYKFENPEDAFKYALENPCFSYPGGETCEEIRERGIAALQEVIEQYNGKKIAIGIHGNILINILRHFNECYDFEFWKATSKPDIYKATFNQNHELIEFSRLWKEQQ